MNLFRYILPTLLVGIALGALGGFAFQLMSDDDAITDDGEVRVSSGDRVAAKTADRADRPLDTKNLRGRGDPGGDSPGFVADAIAAISNESHGPTRRTKIGDLAREWVRVDWEAALEWAETLSPGDRSSALVPIVEGLLQGAGDPVMAVQILDSLDHGEIRDEVLMMNFLAFAKMDKEWALEQVPSFANTYAIHAAADHLAQRDPDFMGNLDFWKDQLPVGAFREKYLLSAVGRMAGTDPGRAVRWLEENRDFDGVAKAYTRMGGVVAGADPRFGLSLAGEIQDEGSRDRFVRGIVQKWSAENPREAKNWLMASVAEGAFHDVEDSVPYLMPAWIGWEGGNVFRSLDALDDEVARAAILDEALTQASVVNPALAAAEIYRGDSRRELVNRGDHVETLVRSWMKREPIAASTWVTTIPEASDKDRAVGVIIDEVLERDGDVEMARKWVSEIADPAVAEEISRKVERFDK